MKRPIKPFVVEVRKGQKKPPVPASRTLPEPPAEDDLLKRAEAALFRRPVEAPGEAAATPEPPQRRGRILESISSAEPEPEVLPEEPIRRRGRPPGSKNKARVEQPAASLPKRRGRPPRNPEGEVRRVALTPELASAALETMAKVAVSDAPVFRRMPQSSDTSVPTAPIKRPRGRPRKSESVRAAETSSGARGTAAQVPVPLGDGLPRELRAALEGGQNAEAIVARLGRTRAGERWKRRLRGPARKVFDRRHQKG